MTVVGPPAGDVTTRTPSTASSRSVSPARPLPGRDGGPAPPVVRDLEQAISRSPARHTSTDARVARACLLMFWSSSETVKYAIPSIACAGPRVQVRPHLDRATGTVQREAMAERAASRPRSVRTAGWMPAGEVAELLKGDLHLAVGLVDHPRGGLGVVRELLLRQTEVHGEGDEAGLGPVVQVAFDAAQVGGGGVHHHALVDSSSVTRVASRGRPQQAGAPSAGSPSASPRTTHGAASTSTRPTAPVAASSAGRVQVLRVGAVPVQLDAVRPREQPGRASATAGTSAPPARTSRT
ncbi:hypothetical protein SMICM17S_10507 [Streptomyces microflavus]